MTLLCHGLQLGGTPTQSIRYQFAHCLMQLDHSKVGAIMVYQLRVTR